MTIVDWLQSITVKIQNIIIRFSGLSGLHQSIMGEITLTKVVLSRSGHPWGLPLLTGVPKGCVLSPLLYFLITNNCRPVHGFQISRWTWTWHLYLKGPLLVHQGLQPLQKPSGVYLSWGRWFSRSQRLNSQPMRMSRGSTACVQVTASLKFPLTLIHSLLQGLLEPPDQDQDQDQSRLPT